ncbi:30S ribosomal protein S16 [Legionella sp. W05-934-2]|jgi:small subunit ribosomal protein S16|uniref:30S ribosomal protein S16 n=1 Tax=Legionella sp. W05-934-2 TaxID=1198649 RepID=UPI003461C9B1
MVVIRLLRAGAKKRPFYHVIVTDSRKRRDTGSCIARIGFYNPIARGQEVELNIDLEKIKHWQSIGAQISERVKALVKKAEKRQAESA